MIEMLNKINLSYIPPEQISHYRKDISNIYREAFAQPPYNQGESAVIRFSAALEHHKYRQGFRCVVARPSSNDPIVGFAFGYTVKPGQWWRDSVASAMKPRQAERWLSDCFELAELAVIPSYQGRGVGGELHETLLIDLPHQTAALSTIHAESNAIHLYRKRGWITLIEDLIFPGGLRGYMILGLDLCKVKQRG